MSPQFVDFDNDGRLDIVAGIFDGSPHVARGTAQGWGKPEQILDRDGRRIVLNAFWNFDTKKWDKTNRCDAARASGGEGHLTSAVAYDWDGDGDLDLLLGDHRSGRVFRRLNEGSPQQPKFTTVNELVLADGQPIDVAGTVATLRLVDWNRDGRLDLACGSMGDAYQDELGGGVVLFVDTHAGKGPPVFGPPITLIERSKKGAQEPTRPDSGIYMDFGDHDGDGDLDLVVGGYSHWTPKPWTLTPGQQARAAELKQAVAKTDQQMEAFYDAIEKALEGLDEAAADKKRGELFAERRAKLVELNKQRKALDEELDPLVPGSKRKSFVWLYENQGASGRPAAPPR